MTLNRWMQKHSLAVVRLQGRRTVVRLKERRGMSAQTSLAALAMEAQVALRDQRRAMAPMYEAALRSGNGAAISEAKHVAESIRIAEKQANRLAGIADGLVICADGLFEPGHGRAA
jgi:hypothetical protein